MDKNMTEAKINIKLNYLENP